VNLSLAGASTSWYDDPELKAHQARKWLVFEQDENGTVLKVKCSLCKDQVFRNCQLSTLKRHLKKTGHIEKFEKLKRLDFVKQSKP
jgi:hypothetical protein